MRRWLLAVLLVGLAPPAVAKPATGPAPHIDSIRKIEAVRCETDEGTFPCGPGVRYLGELMRRWFNQRMETESLPCTSTRPTTVVVRLGYEWNTGVNIVYDSAKVQARWPACVQQFVKRVGVKHLEWRQILFDMGDSSVDVRSEYRMMIVIAP